MPQAKSSWVFFFYAIKLRKDFSFLNGYINTYINITDLDS